MKFYEVCLLVVVLFVLLGLCFVFGCDDRVSTGYDGVGFNQVLRDEGVPNMSEMVHKIKKRSVRGSE